MKSVTKWSAHKNSPCRDIPFHFICFEKKAQIVFVVVVVGHYSERDQSWFLIAFYLILLERRWYIKVRGWWVVAVHTLVLLLRLLITYQVLSYDATIFYYSVRCLKFFKSLSLSQNMHLNCFSWLLPIMFLFSQKGASKNYISSHCHRHIVCTGTITVQEYVVVQLTTQYRVDWRTSGWCSSHVVFTENNVLPHTIGNIYLFKLEACKSRYSEFLFSTMYSQLHHGSVVGSHVSFYRLRPGSCRLTWCEI